MEIKKKGATAQSVAITSQFSFANQSVENEPAAFLPYYKNINSIY